MKTLEKTSLITKGLVLGATLLWVPMSAMAGPYGYDLHNVLSPKAAGMAGTTIAGDNAGPVEAVYGNPANLADFYAARTGQTAGTQFTFGATLYHPEAIARHNGSVTGLAGGGAFRERSQAESYAVPQVAFTQDLSGVGIPIVLGGGFSAVSGIGVDWRSNPNALGVGAEFIVLGVNLGAGYEVMPNLDVGFAATISYAMLEAGLAGTSGQAHDYGIRGTFGADYHLTDATDIGFYYQTELRHNWNNFVHLSHSNAVGTDSHYSDLDVEQPANIAFGISHKFADNMRGAVDMIFKRWSEAAFWERIYHDQTVFSIGGEYDHGPWTFRAGYGYANNPNRSTVEARSLEGFDFICTGSVAGAACLPLTGSVGGAVWSWVQAMEGPVIYKHRASVGFTYNGFLAPFLDLDVHLAHQFQEEEWYDASNNDGSVDADGVLNNFQNHTELDVQSWHGGFALTWAF